MGLTDFFNSVANNFISHYRQLAQKVNYGPTHQIEDQPNNSTPPPADSVELSPEAQNAATGSNSAAPTDKTNTVPTTNNDDAVATDKNETPENLPATDDTATYNSSMKRKAKLDYHMKLEFNLTAITQTIERIENGDTSAIEEFAAAGFVLNAAMDFKGRQVVKTYNEAGDAANVHLKGRERASSKQAAQYQSSSRNFDVQSFMNESTKVRRNMNFRSHNNHTKTVNKFALRYNMDSQMSFASLNRFNTQTQQVSETDPANLNNYLDTAGNVVEKSTPELMATFFDAVDGYLASAEQSLMAKADEFFSMAAEALGFSGEMVDAAKEQFVGTIESFFDKVNTAVDSLEPRFVPQTTTPEPIVIEPLIPELEIPETEPFIPQLDLLLPEVEKEEDESKLAMA